MPDKNRISETFNGGTVFITGGTGTIGKPLIEKLLRCTDVKRIYLLIRDKQEKSASERLDKLFSNKLFEPLKGLKPDAVQKCELIYGDILQGQLGISPGDRRRLSEEVDFVFHLAASVRFDLTAKEAVRYNVRSTKELLDMAHSFKKLKLFVHVSTAFAFPKEPVLEEKAYEPSCDPHLALEMIETSTDKEIETLLGDSPNSYIFSKGLSEKLVVEQMDMLPLIIVRPSVVCPIWLEPVPGWCNNLQGPAGLFVAAGKGIMRTVYLKGNSYMDFIPVDIVINALLVATWNYINISEEDRIVNAVASTKARYTWKQILDTAKDIIYTELPFNGVVWYPGGSMKSSRTVHWFCFYLFQIIPALLIDTVLIVTGYKPILYQIQRRLQKGTDVFEYFSQRQWNFSNKEHDKVLKNMTAKERQVYVIEDIGFDVRKYLLNCIKYVRKYYLKESDESIPAAKKHMKRMWVLDIFTKLLLSTIFIYYCYKWISAFLADVI